MADLKSLGADAKAWPFAGGRSLLKRAAGKGPEKGYVLFETGYGPSGLPHIGTFGEVVRTTMVRRAFEAMSDIPTKLFAFSDDMDGLRKVPENVPQQEMMALYKKEKVNPASGCLPILLQIPIFFSLYKFRIFCHSLLHT